MNRKNRILIKETVSSDEDLSEDEDISTFETEDSSTTTTRQDGYVRQLKGMPMFNPTLRRHAVSAPCLYKMKKKNNASARAVITGCFGSGQQRGLVVDTKKDDDEEENDQKKESKQTKDEEEVVIQQQLSDVIQEREASQMFFRFMSKHDKRVANRSLRFLLELERLEKKMKSLNSKKLEERVTDMLNEYIIRGSERMLDLTDPERREISNLVRSSPGLSNFDIARDKVIRQLLHKMHRPGKKALSLFGLWLEHVREVEGMNISEGGDDDDEEELPLPVGDVGVFDVGALDVLFFLSFSLSLSLLHTHTHTHTKQLKQDVDTKSLQRVLKRHPLFSSLPESVLTSLVTKFELRTLNRHETLIKNLDKTEMKKQKKNDIKNIRYDEMYVVASGKFEVYLELSPEESRLEVLRQRKKREDGASDILKRIVRKRKGATTSNNDELSGMKSSSVLKRILGHVDLTKFRWYGWAGPTETIRAVAVLHDARPNVWVRASPEERSRVWAIRREHVREVLRHGMSKHRDWIVSKLRDASPKVLGILERNEIDSFADSVRVEVYKDNERVLACGTYLYIYICVCVCMCTDPTIITSTQNIL